MSSFDVGDKVKIREDLVYDRYYGDIRCSWKRLECRGKIGEITKIAKTGSYFVHNHWFSEEMLEGCDSKNTLKFKSLWDGIDEFYKHYILAKPCGENNNIDAMRYCMKDCIVTKDYCEKIKEEKDMNKVVNLWYERKKNKIDERYKLMEVQFYNDKYSVVESFNELIEKFNNDLDDLYKLDKATEQFVLKENTPNNVIKYCLDLDSLKERFNVEYLIEKNKEIEELGKIKEEVEAQLSLSNDLEYQQEVLIRYGIIDKKTKKISE